MLSNVANQPSDNDHRPENNSHPPAATGQIEGNQATPLGPLDLIPMPADPPSRPESQLVVDVKDVTKSSAKSPTSTASSSSPKPASPSSSSGPSKEAQKFNNRVALHQQLYAKFFKNISEGRPMNDPKEDPFQRRKASSSSPSPKLHHRSQSEAARKSSSCRPSMERTHSPFARHSSSRSSSISAKSSSASSPSGSPKLKPKSLSKPSTSSEIEVPKSDRSPEVLGAAGSSAEEVEKLEVKEEVKAEVVEVEQLQTTAETPEVVKSEPIALPTTPATEAPAGVTLEATEVPATEETISLPEVETVTSTLVHPIPLPQEALPIKASEVVNQESESPSSASLTPTDTDSGEERTPTETNPAQKSDASPSTASFTSSRSASPVRQDNVEDAPEVVEVAPVPEHIEPVEEPVEQISVQARGKTGRFSKKAAKEGTRKKLTAAERHKLAREQKIEKAVKRQEKHRQRTLRWYFTRVLEFGVQTMDLNEKTKKKLRTYIKKRLHEDSKYLTVQINLDTRFCDDGDYRRCRQYFLDTTCKTVAPKRSVDDEEEDETGAKAAKTENGGRSTSKRSKKKIPANVPLFSLYGELYVPIDISAKQLMERAGKRMQTGKNEVFRSERSTSYPRVPPPRPDPNFLDEEMDYFRAMMHNEGNEEMQKVMEKFEGIDAIRIPCPELPVRTPEDIHDERFKRILLSTSITNVDGFGKALGIDTSKFTIEAIMEAHPELVMDELYQCPQSANHNYDPDGDETWYAKSENRAVKVKTFGADYIKRRNVAIETVKKFIASDDWPKAEEEITKSFLENRYCHPKDDQTMFFTRFGTNIDIQHPEKFKAQLIEIDKLPKFMQPEREGNLINLSYVGQEIFGVNTVQMYVKPPGARTCAHMENALMASINWNLGPGTCVWYAVPYEYYGKIRELVDYHKQSYFSQNYWPDEQELLSEGIPVIKFEQKADQLVYVNTGCFHWVQSNGFCANVSWNVGQPNFVQLATTMISYSDDLYGAHQHHFPLIATTWKYAQQKLFLDDPEVSKVVRSILLRSFAHSKMKYDSAVAAGIEVIYREDRPCFMHMNRCFQCMQEIFNFITWWVVPTNIDPFLSIEKNRQEREREAAEKAEKLKNQEEIIEFPKLSKQEDLPEKYCSFCDKCSKIMHRDYAGTFRTETTMYYSLEEMSEIFDSYRSTPLP